MEQEEGGRRDSCDGTRGGDEEGAGGTAVMRPEEGRQEEQAKEQRCTERLERRGSVVEDEVCEDSTEVSLCFTCQQRNL